MHNYLIQSCEFYNIFISRWQRTDTELLQHNLVLHNLKLSFLTPVVGIVFLLTPGLYVLNALVIRPPLKKCLFRVIRVRVSKLTRPDALFSFINIFLLTPSPQSQTSMSSILAQPYPSPSMQCFG